MSKFDHARMIEECAEYQEYLEQWEDDDLLLEEMAEYYLEQGNLELLGLNNGWKSVTLYSVLWISLDHLFWWVSWPWILECMFIVKTIRADI